MYSVINPLPTLHLTADEQVNGRDFRVDLLLASIDRDRTLFEMMGGSVFLKIIVNQHGLTLTWSGQYFTRQHNNLLRHNNRADVLRQIQRETSGLPVTTSVNGNDYIVSIMRPDNEHWSDPRIDEYLSQPQHKPDHEKLLPICMESIVLKRTGDTVTDWCIHGYNTITRDVWYVPTKFVRSHDNVFKAA